MDVLRRDINRSDLRGSSERGPDWLGILYAEQLGRELDWADDDLAATITLTMGSEIFL